MSNRKILTLSLFAILHLAGALLSVVEPRAPLSQAVTSGREEDDAALATADQAGRERVDEAAPRWRLPVALDAID